MYDNTEVDEASCKKKVSEDLCDAYKVKSSLPKPYSKL